MRSSTLLSTFCALALAAPCLAANPTAGERKAVEQASERFYTSLNAMFRGETAPMQQIWSHAADITCMGPAGGMLVGWDQVRSAWEMQAALKLGGKIEPSNVQIVVGDDLAVVSCFEVGENRDLQGRPIQVSIRATNTFRKENGEWKMIGHHTDLLPFLEGRTQTTAAK